MRCVLLYIDIFVVMDDVLVVACVSRPSLPFPIGVCVFPDEYKSSIGFQWYMYSLQECYCVTVVVV